MEGKEVLVYCIEIISGSKKWTIRKRYHDFFMFNKEMKSKHSNMPALPPWTYLPLKYDKDIEDRKVGLNNYLQGIMNRVDFRTSPIFRKFIEITEESSTDYHASKKFMIENLTFGARDFELLPDLGLLFVAQSEMNIANRIDSYITNVSFKLFSFFQFSLPFWENKSKS